MALRLMIYSFLMNMNGKIGLLMNSSTQSKFGNGFGKQGAK